MSADTFSQLALQALKSNEPEKAVAYFEQALEHAERPRPDILHSMGVVLLQLGEPEKARPLMQQALEQAWKVNAEPELLLQCALGLAAASEDSDHVGEALAAYEQAFEVDARSDRALVGKAHLLLGLGRLDEAVGLLERYLEFSKDDAEYLDAAKALVEHVKAFQAEGEPITLLRAHRESYIEFFDETMKNMAEQGWIGECARMMRDDSGQVVNVIPEGARPYAAVRVDLVDPSTGQAGQIGEQPMVVAVGGFEALAQAPVSFDVEGRPYRLRVSSQAPWDQLPISILLEKGDAEQICEPIFATWYTAGFNGQFGEKEKGRFHYISDPIVSRSGRGITFHLDLGRSEERCIEHLLARIDQLHQEVGVVEVLLGRGYLSPV
ncbi:MAG: tetratricopeptide repeat protein [Myxococcota bacterium]|nr:tetratricopeptide repeat protein [Myxococcota bacterium]